MFAAKQYHIWREIYGIMAANLYRAQEANGLITGAKALKTHGISGSARQFSKV